MELFIALAIMIGLLEIKEFRNSKRIKLLSQQIKSAHRVLDRLEKRNVALEQTLLAQGVLINSAKVMMGQVVEQSEKSAEFVQSVDGSLQTILKEYEVNGVPLGYQRKPVADFIEGL